MMSRRIRVATVIGAAMFAVVGSVGAALAAYEPPSNDLLVPAYHSGPYAHYLALKPGWHALGSPVLPIVRPTPTPGTPQQTMGGKSPAGSVMRSGSGSRSVEAGVLTATPEQRLEMRLKSLATSLR